MKNSVLIILLTFWTISSFSQDEFSEKIVVEGNSMIHLSPELVHFRVGFSVKDTNYLKCSNLAMTKINEIKEQFYENNIDTNLIRTISCHIREDFGYDNELRLRVFQGYIAEIPVSIKTTIDDPVSNQIFEIIKNNFKSNFEINFELSENQTKETKVKLIKLAVKDGKEKAQILAQSLDVELGNIHKIQYGDFNEIRKFTGSSNGSFSVNVQYEVADKSIAISRTLTPSDIIMRTNVMLAWRIKD